MTTESNVNPLKTAEKAPFGVFPAKIESIVGEEKDNFEKTAKEMKAVFKFNIIANGKEFPMFLDFAPLANPKYKLYKFVTMLTGRAFPLPSDENEATAVYWNYLQTLVGTKCQVQVGPNTKGNPKIITAFPLQQQETIAVDPSRVEFGASA